MSIKYLSVTKIWDHVKICCRKIFGHFFGRITTWRIRHAIVIFTSQDIRLHITFFFNFIPLSPTLFQKQKRRQKIVVKKWKAFNKCKYLWRICWPKAYNFELEHLFFSIVIRTFGIVNTNNNALLYYTERNVIQNKKEISSPTNSDLIKSIWINWINIIFFAKHKV